MFKKFQHSALRGAACPGAVLLSLCLIIYSQAFGHVPILDSVDSSPKNPIILPRPYDRSIAIYTQFSEPHDIDVYEFEVTPSDIKDGPAGILIGTLVPACAPLRKLFINWILLGPNVVRPHEVITNIGPERIQIDRRRMIIEALNLEQGPIWHEPYSRHYYFRQKRTQLKLQELGRYQIYVWSESNLGGDYVFEFGDFEKWRFRDVLYTAWVMPRLWLEDEIITPGCSTNILGE